MMQSDKRYLLSLNEQTSIHKQYKFIILFFTLLILSGLIMTAEVFILILLDTAQANADENVIISMQKKWLALFFAPVIENYFFVNLPMKIKRNNLRHVVIIFSMVCFIYMHKTFTSLVSIFLWYCLYDYGKKREMNYELLPMIFHSLENAMIIFCIGPFVDFVLSVNTI